MIRVVNIKNSLKIKLKLAKIQPILGIQLISRRYVSDKFICFKYISPHNCQLSTQNKMKLEAANIFNSMNIIISDIT